MTIILKLIILIIYQLLSHPQLSLLHILLILGLILILEEELLRKLPLLPLNKLELGALPLTLELEVLLLTLELEVLLLLTLERAVLLAQILMEVLLLLTLELAVLQLLKFLLKKMGEMFLSSYLVFYYFLFYYDNLDLIKFS